MVMINYIYDIVSLECKPEVSGVANIVETIHWTVSAVGDGFVSSTYGSVNLTINEESSFQPYENLTKDEIITWAKTALGEQQIADIEASLAAQIEAAKNPPVVRPSLPWSV
jgi:hypothetical protein